MDPTDSLTSALAGRYAIDREIGRGGMATVYLARDVKHDRSVALKVLDPELGAVLGSSRFLAEIKVTANLQHPNLLPLFDSGEAAGLLYYVMPYVEGESLRARLDRERQLPVEEAIRIATAIANALEYAHAHGVVHRDLKPENVLLQAGQPIVADFGIALAVSNAGGARVTQTGLSLGTPTYMSPEQATGDRAIDARSDVYALGAMTYEMLVGEPPHTGSTAQAIIARLITERPRPVRASRPAVPEHVDQAIMRALEKLPADRWAGAGQFRDALLGRLPAGIAMPSQHGASSRRTRALWALALVPSIAFATLLAVHVRAKSPEARPLRFSVPLGEGIGVNSEYDFAVAPDGSAIAFTAGDSAGVSSLWVRRLDSLAAHRIADSQGASAPFWSPDSKSVGFFADATLKRVDLDEGRPATLCETSGSSRSGAWMTGDEIVFARGEGPLQRVSSRGGSPVPATTLDTGRAETVHTLPQALSDGRHFLYRSNSYRSGRALIELVGSLDGGVAHLLTTPATVWFAPPGNLLMLRDGEMKAVELDGKTFLPRGDPVRVPGLDAEAGSYSISRDVLVAGGRSAAPLRTSIELLDRSGNSVRTLAAAVDLGGRDYALPRLTPDGRSVGFEHHLGQGGGDLYVADVATGHRVRETFAPETHHGYIAWAPDGKRLIYVSTASGGGDLHIKVLGAPTDRPLGPSTPFQTAPSDWSADGKYLLFDRVSARSDRDVWLMQVETGTSQKLLDTPANEMQATFSPDGHWIAYASDELNGRFEIFIRPFPATGQQWKISSAGGEAPRWRRDGKELFYLAPPTHRFTVMASVVNGGASFTWETPKALFTRPIRATVGVLRSAVHYDVAPDGRTFVAVLNNEAGSSVPAELRVFVNWRSALRAR